MKCRNIYIYIGILALAGASNVGAQEPHDTAAVQASAGSGDEADIRRLLADGYATAVFVSRDEAAVRRAFHPGFRMFVLDDEELLLVSLEDWLGHLGLDGVPAAERIDHRVTSVAVTGDAAAARVEIREEGSLVYSDHFLLYRFPDLGWRIVGKAFHDHE